MVKWNLLLLLCVMGAAVSLVGVYRETRGYTAQEIDALRRIRTIRAENDVLRAQSAVLSDSQAVRDAALKLKLHSPEGEEIQTGGY